MCDVTYLQKLDKSSSCYSRVVEHQLRHLKVCFSDVGAAAVWHKAFIADFGSLQAGLGAIRKMLVVQGGARFIPDIM